MQSPNGEMGGFGGPPKEEQPWYVKYGVKALGTAAGGVAIFFGLFNLMFSVFSPTCIVFSVWQMLCGFVVIVIESPCCCVFLEHFNRVTEMVDRKPLWIKAAAYIGVPLPAIIFCFGANTFVGSGCIMGVGVLYAMLALGKKASREDMANYAQSAYASAQKSYYEQQTNQSRSGNPTTPATSPGFGDPIQASAAQWAAQSTKYEPPPAYNAPSVNANANIPPRATGWDQSFLNEGASNTATVHSIAASSHQTANPASSDPNNPFH